MKLPKIYSASKQSVVSFSREVKIDENKINFVPFGTGVCIDKSGLILTAYHVVKKYVDSNEFNFNIVFAEIIANEATAVSTVPMKFHCNIKYDYAIIQVANKELVDGKEIIREFPFVKLPKNNQIFVGEDVATLGFPLRTEAFPKALPDLYKGIISRIDYSEKNVNRLENIMLDINVNAGNSGGPVIRIENGELIGIIKSCHTSSEIALNYDEEGFFNNTSEYLQHTNMVDCIPWDLVVSLYNQIKKEIT